ncbi:MAG: DUF1385 domain-containing protein [Tissierellia bacterium]|nr:DUF1385 domain-containing protein [Tissierellia bacterium]
MHKTSIGGQALIEGIMMRGPNEMAIAVRKPNKEIDLKVDKLNTLGMRYKFFRMPFLRGMISLIESLSIGVKALMYSAEFFEDEEDIEEGSETWIQKVFKDKAEDVEVFLTLLIAIVLSIGIFMILPNFITSLVKGNITNSVILNLVEGLIRIIVFLIYVVWVAKLDDVRRVFEYHGAEHKTIHCYEHGDDLTVENVKKYSILHPRCGTSFLFMVMIVSILVLSFFGWPNPVLRVVIRIVMFPVIAGISYEINRLIGKSDSSLAYYLSYPGLMIQKFATVKEPDDEQIEVAIKSLIAVIPEDREADQWK